MTAMMRGRNRASSHGPDPVDRDFGCVEAAQARRMRWSVRWVAADLQVIREFVCLMGPSGSGKSTLST